MDLSQYTKENKNLLKKEESKSEDKPVNQNIIHTKSAGRPALKNQKERLNIKITININEEEKFFLDTLNQESGIPVSTYLRRKLLAIKAFNK